MKLEIKYNHIPVSEPLEQYIEKRVYFAFSRFSDKIISVEIRLHDLNGPKGGLDKKCLVALRMKSKTLWSEGIEDNLYKSADVAIDRLRRRMMRDFDRAKRSRFKARVSTQESSLDYSR